MSGLYSDEEIADRILETCVEVDGHQIWQGTRAGEGYPATRLLRGEKVKTTLLRPFIWSAINGETKSKISMTCGIRLCINPEHMEEVKG